MRTYFVVQADLYYFYRESRTPKIRINSDEVMLRLNLRSWLEDMRVEPQW